MSHLEPRPKVKRLRNQRGFTLIESIIYIALVVTSLAAAYTAFTKHAAQYVSSMTRLKDEDALIKAESVIRKVLRDAVQVQSLPPVTAGYGWINTAFGNTLPVAALNGEFGKFYRETSNGASAAAPQNSSIFAPTGLLWIAPYMDIAGNEFPGAVIADLEQPGSTNIYYTYNHSYASDLSNIMISNPVVNVATGSLISVDVTIWARVFSPSIPLNQRCFRFGGAMGTNMANTGVAGGPCGAKNIGHQVVSSFTVLLRNNTNETNPLNPAISERGFGPIYFFQPFGEYNQ